MTKTMVTWVHPPQEGNEMKAHLMLDGKLIEHPHDDMLAVEPHLFLGIENIMLNGDRYDTNPLGPLLSHVREIGDAFAWRQLGLYEFLRGGTPLQYAVVGALPRDRTRTYDIHRWKVGIVHASHGASPLSLNKRDVINGLMGTPYYRLFTAE